jgi:hypothetical protein
MQGVIYKYSDRPGEVARAAAASASPAARRHSSLALPQSNSGAKSLPPESPRAPRLAALPRGPSGVEMLSLCSPKAAASRGRVSQRRDEQRGGAGGRGLRHGDLCTPL